VGQLFSAATVGAVAASLGGGVSGYSSAFLVIAVVGLAMVLVAIGLKNRKAELARVAQLEQKPA
jgi:hypothetical protein